ncbi:MAG: associated Golgi protein-like protein [Herminiimonas sp.]|nr:associated Golgi protein-like protein [Herminiimonas sp.]
MNETKKQRFKQDIEEELIDEADIRDAATLEFSHRTTTKSSLFTVLARMLRRKRFILAVLLLVMAGLVLYLRQIGYLTPQHVLADIQQHPSLAPIIFALVYAAMVIFLLPTLPLNLAAGFLWGPVGGTVLSVFAATLGASISFLAARYLVGSFLRDKFRSRVWRWLQLEIKKSEWQVMGFTRLNPIFPFGPLNYFFGFTSVTFGRFLWTTALFIVPPSALFSVIGDSIGGIVMDGASQNLVRNVVAFSAGVTALVVLRLAMKRFGVFKKLK